MTKIIEFLPKNVVKLPVQPSKEEIVAWQFTQDIDSVILSAIKSGVTPAEVCVLLANRLGEASSAAYSSLDGTPFESLDSFLQYLYTHVSRQAKK